MNHKAIAIFATIVVLFLIVYCYIWYLRFNEINSTNKNHHKNHHKNHQNQKIVLNKNAICFFCGQKAIKVRILDPDAGIPVDKENGELLVQLSEAEKMTLYSCEQCIPIAGSFRTTKWIQL